MFPTLWAYFYCIYLQPEKEEHHLKQGPVIKVFIHAHFILCQCPQIQTHIFPTVPLIIQRSARGWHFNQRLSKVFLFLLSVTCGSICYVQLRSQPVEGGGHRLHTELEESLTKDDAGADQRDAARDGGDHDSQDQRCRHWPLRSRALRGCWERDEKSVG